MSVILAIINKYCTVHATDSKIGSRKKGETKIVSVRRWKGAIAYWGLAKHYNWSTLDWIKEKVSSTHNYKSPEKFAKHLAKDLEKEISKINFRKPINSGIGIHFTAYENIGSYLIPELFLIKNFENPSYNSVYPDGSIRIFRNTLAAICNMGEKEKKLEHRKSQYRKVVHDVLQAGRQLYFNNGDPILFNVIAPSIFDMFKIFNQRKYLKDPIDPKTYHDMAKMIIETIVKAQTKFCKKENRLVAGRAHVLAIKPNGDYYSDTGDKLI